MKIRPVGAELVNADRRSDTAKLIVPFLNFANARKNAVLLNFVFWGLVSFGIALSCLTNLVMCMTSATVRS